MPIGHIRPLAGITAAVDPDALATRPQPLARTLKALPLQPLLKLKRLTPLDRLQGALIAPVQRLDALAIGRLIAPKLEPGAGIVAGLRRVGTLGQEPRRHRREPNRRHQHDRQQVTAKTHQNGAIFSIIVPITPGAGCNAHQPRSTGPIELFLNQ